MTEKEVFSNFQNFMQLKLCLLAFFSEYLDFVTEILNRLK